MEFGYGGMVVFCFDAAVQKAPGGKGVLKERLDSNEIRNRGLLRAPHM